MQFEFDICPRRSLDIRHIKSRCGHLRSTASHLLPRVCPITHFSRILRGELYGDRYGACAVGPKSCHPVALASLLLLTTAAGISRALCQQDRYFLYLKSNCCLDFPGFSYTGTAGVWTFSLKALRRSTGRYRGGISMQTVTERDRDSRDRVTFA